ncbi:MAG: 5-hydroxyisourate hydrolase, partial [Colwellia sp.]
MSQITTHILDTTRGLPAQNVPITLFAQDGDSWQEINGGVTN